MKSTSPVWIAGTHVFSKPVAFLTFYLQLLPWYHRSRGGSQAPSSCQHRRSLPSAYERHTEGCIHHLPPVCLCIHAIHARFSLLSGPTVKSSTSVSTTQTISTRSARARTLTPASGISSRPSLTSPSSQPREIRPSSLCTSCAATLLFC